MNSTLGFGRSITKNGHKGQWCMVHVQRLEAISDRLGTALTPSLFVEFFGSLQRPLSFGLDTALARIGKIQLAKALSRQTDVDPRCVVQGLPTRHGHGQIRILRETRNKKHELSSLDLQLSEIG